VTLIDRLVPIGSRRRTFLRGPVRAGLAVKHRLLPGTKLRDEQAALRRTWARHSADSLEDYLVSGYQNPRINAQSILTRHLLIRQLFGDQEFAPLMADELRFCAETNEALRVRAKELGVPMGSYLDVEKRAAVALVCEAIADREDTFERRWRETLAGRTAPPLKVLEFACGSANDYRSLAAYGIAPLLDYTGVDLNEANIANARKRFPGVAFQIGSVLDLPFEDASFDYVLAFDIFEHLSLEAMERAMSEAVRLAGKGVVLAFFIMVDAPEHNERPRNSYHWNELSVHKIEQRLRTDFTDVQVTYLPAFMKEGHGLHPYYNKKAYTIIAQGRRPAAA
jgi:ubiquinone/menaquinone biosynthesis C-methylase UbiE